MDNGSNKELVEKINRIEEDIFEGKSIDIREFYQLKKQLIDNKSVHGDLLELFLLLEAMLDKSNNELMNKRLNLLTIWYEFRRHPFLKWRSRLLCLRWVDSCDRLCHVQIL